MRLDGIGVAKLFGSFTHELHFKPHERIAIMIGPNGLGKTMLLRMLNALFSQSLRSLATMPFGQLDTHFDDSSALTVSRTLDGEQATLRFMYRDSTGRKHRFDSTPLMSAKQLSFPLHLVDEFVPELVQVGPSQWRVRATAEDIDLGEVLERFSDRLPIDAGAVAPKMPEWLHKMREALPVRFISTERLTFPLPYRGRRSETSTTGTWARTVRRFSEELAEHVRKTLTQYGVLAQSLDRTFPARLVREPSQGDVAMAGLRQQLADVDARRAQLVEAGLLAPEQEGWGVPALDTVDDSRRGVLAVFAQDANKKLGVFDELYARVDTLRRVANARFLHKSLTVSNEGLVVQAPDGTKLDLEMLSSGEQHELVILYELLFRVPDGSLILIDEPELSLHVAWQEEFLSDLQEIARLGKFNVLLATHSPQIISDRWDLTVELKGPSGA